jgi:hypothetical protein
VTTPLPLLFSVTEENEYWVDPSRSTIVNGQVVERSRTLTTRLFVPTVNGVAAVRYGPFPLFVWSHGFDATVDYFDQLLSAIAARGYVVAAPTFPLTRAGAPDGGVYDDYVNQPADVSFVIGRVLKLDGPKGSEYPGLIDASRIGVGGHSLGAVTTMGLVANRCCVDARVRAAVEIDGAELPFPGGSTVQRGVPVLWMHGDADQTFAVSQSYQMFAQARPPKFLVVLRGMPHTPFKIPAAYDAIVTTVGDFLDVYLKGHVQSVRTFVSDASRSPLAVVEASP